MNDGLYLVNKPVGWTSFDVLAKIKAAVKERTGEKIKIGHAGTLDPFAEGLLIVLTGAMTKKQDQFLKADKEYEAEMVLGIKSSTGDPEGKLTLHHDQEISINQIETVFKSFVGETKQTPSSYSAIKINGERAYRRIRRGEKFIMPERQITIIDLKMMSYQYPIITFSVKCSSGTYIRTLAEDLAKSLGTKGYLRKLKRTAIGDFGLYSAKNVQETINIILAE